MGKEPGQGSQAADLPFVSFTNRSGETVPSHAMMEVLSTSVTDTAHAQIRKPSAANLKNFLINGPAPIPDGEEGEAQAGFNVVARFDPRDGVPDPGTCLGTAAGSWCARPGAAGLVSIVRTDTDLPFVNAHRHCQDCPITTSTTSDNPCTGTGTWTFNPVDRIWVLTTDHCSAGCKPYPPDFCPDPEHCAMIVTQCGHHDLQPATCNICPTTTTTTGDPGTTTTSSTSTTTTADPACAGCCRQEFIGGQWVTVFDNCVSPCFCDIGTPGNPYPPNPNPCSSIDGGTSSGGTGGGGTFCQGACKFVCGPDLGWVYVSSTCLTDSLSQPCYCDTPSGTCGICDAVTYTPCHFPAATTTTGDPSTTTTTGDPGTTTTTTCSPTTTTTFAPGVCVGTCVWRRNDANNAWQFVSSTCVGCSCDSPNTTTTTGDPGTTTTSSTTTTTTTYDPCAYLSIPCGPLPTTTTTTTTGDPGTTTTTTGACGTCTVPLQRVIATGQLCLAPTLEGFTPCNSTGCICSYFGPFTIYPLCSDLTGPFEPEGVVTGDCTDGGGVNTTTTSTTTTTTTAEPCDADCTFVVAGGVVRSLSSCSGNPNCRCCLTGNEIGVGSYVGLPDDTYIGDCLTLPDECSTTTAEPTTTTTTTTASPCPPQVSCGGSCTVTVKSYYVSSVVGCTPTGDAICCPCCICSPTGLNVNVYSDRQILSAATGMSDGTFEGTCVPGIDQTCCPS